MLKPTTALNTETETETETQTKTETETKTDTKTETETTDTKTETETETDTKTETETETETETKTRSRGGWYSPVPETVALTETKTETNTNTKTETETETATTAATTVEIRVVPLQVYNTKTHNYDTRPHMEITSIISGNKTYSTSGNIKHGTLTIDVRKNTTGSTTDTTRIFKREDQVVFFGVGFTIVQVTSMDCDHDNVKLTVKGLDAPRGANEHEEQKKMLALATRAVDRFHKANLANETVYINARVVEVINSNFWTDVTNNALAQLDSRFEVQGIKLMAKGGPGFSFGELFGMKDAHGYDSSAGFVRLPPNSSPAEICTINAEGGTGMLFARPDSCACLVKVSPDDNDEAEPVFLTVNTNQKPACKMYKCTEIPAGMKNTDGDLSGTMVTEIREETGLRIKNENMVFLGRYSPSGGATVEEVFLYYLIVNTPERLIQEMTGKARGKASESERIYIEFVTRNQLDTIRDGKALSALGFLSNPTRGPVLEATAMARALSYSHADYDSAMSTYATEMHV
jgi:hypothetical protein